MKAAVIILFGLYLFKLISNRRRAKRKYKEATKDLHLRIEELLGTEKLEDLKNATIWQGMPDCLMYYAYGIPYKTNKRESPGKLVKTWFYHPIPNVRKNSKRKYKTEIYSTNGFITSWDKIST